MILKTALVIVLLMLLTWHPCSIRSAHAQGCVCVTDPIVESNTGLIAGSVTTSGGAGVWQSAASYLDQLSAATGANVTQPMQADFPGEELLPPDTMPLIHQIVSDSMNTYYNSWNVANEVQGNMDSDDSALASIEQVNQSLGSGGAGGGPSLLAAVQLVVESNLHIAQELQYANELHAVEIKMHAVEHAESLNERAQAEFTEATARNWGSAPQ
jgi:hypothetical protein